MTDTDTTAQPSKPDRTLRLPDGTDLIGDAPIVIIGPNGSGKTRKARDLQATCPIEFVNALRNTRIQPSVPAMAYTDAESQFVGRRDQSRERHWDWSDEFDFLLASLMAQHATDAIKFVDAWRAGEAPPDMEDALQKIRDLWSEVFPGRKLAIDDYRPMITSTTSGQEIQYTAQTMSDGERTAIYLGGRVLRAQPGVLVVDEPENHLHSNLAARLWDEFERARPDLRFVYITHDLTFARSRRTASYVIASPVDGLQAVDLGADVPDDVAEVLLGTASMSFYARRVVLCEGETASRDKALYRAWFNEQDTVVRAVGSSEMVHRCISALAGDWLVRNLKAVGIIDRDFHTDEYLATLPSGLVALPLHEVESLYCLPAVVAAVAAHLQKCFDAGDYLTCLRESVTVPERHKVVLERWKQRIEPRLIAVVAKVHARQDPLETIVAALAQTFDPASWDFNAAELLREEKERVETAATVGDVEGLLRLLPGKGRLAAAAQYVGLHVDAYVHLINQSLRGADGLDTVGAAVDTALAPHLPVRALSPT